MNASDIVKKIREDAHMTQEEFAKAVDCKQSAISKIELGKVLPSIKTAMSIIKLAKSKKIKISLEDLFKGKEKE